MRRPSGAEAAGPSPAASADWRKATSAWRRCRSARPARRGSPRARRTSGPRPSRRRAPAPPRRRRFDPSASGPASPGPCRAGPPRSSRSRSNRSTSGHLLGPGRLDDRLPGVRAGPRRSIRRASGIGGLRICPGPIPAEGQENRSDRSASPAAPAEIGLVAGFILPPVLAWRRSLPSGPGPSAAPSIGPGPPTIGPSTPASVPARPPTIRRERPVPPCFAPRRCSIPPPETGTIGSTPSSP